MEFQVKDSTDDFNVSNTECENEWEWEGSKISFFLLKNRFRHQIKYNRKISQSSP